MFFTLKILLLLNYKQTQLDVCLCVCYLSLHFQCLILMASNFRHSFGDKFSKNYWLKEIQGQKEIINLYGGVDLDDIRGMRAPFLQTGGNKMFEMLYEANFTYDSSLPVYDINPPFWPYTLDYQISHECMIPPCPTKSFPGKFFGLKNSTSCFRKIQEREIRIII